MKLSPSQSLALLILVGVAISGWLYGIHWKKVASGSSFNIEEKLVIQLQDQIRALSEENGKLASTLSELENPQTEDSDPVSPLPIDSATSE